MSEIIVESRFRGPPRSGNGGYVTGLFARLAGGPRSVMVRAPVPLDTPMTFDPATATVTLGDQLIAQANPADHAVLPDPPAAPSLAEAEAAGARAGPSFHSICVCCGDKIGADEGLRVFVGQLADAEPGLVAGVWDVHTAFVDDDGLVPEELVWAAIDCPGFVAWVAKDGRHGALTGTMQAEVLRRPAAGERCIVLGWPIERPSERREVAGVALFAADGTLMARGLQTWIRMPPRPPQPDDR